MFPVKMTISRGLTYNMHLRWQEESMWHLEWDLPYLPGPPWRILSHCEVPHDAHQPSQSQFPPRGLVGGSLEVFVKDRFFIMAICVHECLLNFQIV